MDRWSSPTLCVYIYQYMDIPVYPYTGIWGITQVVLSVHVCVHLSHTKTHTLIFPLSIPWLCNCFSKAFIPGYCQLMIDWNSSYVKLSVSIWNSSASFHICFQVLWTGLGIMEQWLLWNPGLCSERSLHLTHLLQSTASTWDGEVNYMEKSVLGWEVKSHHCKDHLP